MVLYGKLLERLCWIASRLHIFDAYGVLYRVLSRLQKAKLFYGFVSEPVRRPDAIEFPTHALQNFLPQTVTVTRIFG